jgi:hypothetical protein
MAVMENAGAAPMPTPEAIAANIDAMTDMSQVFGGREPIQAIRSRGSWPTPARQSDRLNQLFVGLPLR